MMNFDYTKIAKTTSDLITKFGTSSTVTHSNAIIDPVTGISTGSPTTETFMTISPPISVSSASSKSSSAFEQHMIGIAAQLNKTVKFFILATLDSTLVPTTSDTITFDSVVYSIIGVTCLAPAGVVLSNICYKIGAVA